VTRAIAVALASCTFVAPAFAQQAEKPDPPPVEFRWGAHPSLRFKDTVRIDFRGRFQGDVRRSEAPFEDEDDALDVAWRRIGIDGEIRNLLAFQVERELASDVPWRDVYVDYRQFTTVRVQAGKFKLPFSLDENTSATNLDFVYRSLAATELAPGRDRGVMVHGRLFDRAIGYEVGAFAHDGDNTLPRDDLQQRAARTTALRFTTEPFFRSSGPAATLRAAIAWTAGDVDEGVSSIRGRTPLRASFFPGEMWVSGARRRTGMDVRWMPGPFSVQAEYIRLSEERLGQGIDNGDLAPVVASGWYVSGTWAVTGERKARGLDSPPQPLFQGGFGAIEVAARVESLAFGEGDAPGASISPRADVLFGNRDRVVTLGANWYINRWVKVQANVIRDALRDPSRGPLPEAQAFWSQAVRVQVTI
jgi:phosphate-selective porin